MTPQRCPQQGLCAPNALPTLARSCPRRAQAPTCFSQTFVVIIWFFSSCGGDEMGRNERRWTERDALQGVQPPLPLGFSSWKQLVPVQGEGEAGWLLARWQQEIGYCSAQLRWEDKQSPTNRWMDAPRCSPAPKREVGDEGSRAPSLLERWAGGWVACHPLEMGRGCCCLKPTSHPVSPARGQVDGSEQWARSGRSPEHPCGSEPWLFHCWGKALCPEGHQTVPEHMSSSSGG